MFKRKYREDAVLSAYQEALKAQGKQKGTQTQAGANARLNFPTCPIFQFNGVLYELD